MFCKENRESVVKNEGISGSAVMTRLSSLWKNLPEDQREEYKKKAKENKIRDLGLSNTTTTNNLMLQSYDTPIQPLSSQLLTNPIAQSVLGTNTNTMDQLNSGKPNSFQ